MKGFDAVLKAATKDLIQDDFVGLITCAAGKQGSKCIGNGADGLDLSFNDIPTMWYNINHNNATQEQLADITQRERKLWMHTFEKTMLFKNQGPTTAVMYLYDIVLKKNAKHTSTTGNNPLPREDWNNGLIIQQGLGTTPSRDYWGSRPTDSNLFRRNWTIKRIRRIEMGSGRTHEHIFKFNYHGLLPLADGEENSMGFPGVTNTVLAVVHGTPTDATTDHTSATHTSLDLCKIVVTGHYRVYLSPVTSKSKITYQTATAIKPDPARQLVQAEDSANVVFETSLNIKEASGAIFA